MSIRVKSLLIIGTTIVALAFAIDWFARGFLLNRFADLGVQFAREDMSRLLNAIDDESSNLKSTSWDWSAWDATYAFAQDGNPTYINENLVAGTFTTLTLNLLVIVRNDGTIVWGSAFDLRTKQMVPLPATFRECVRVGQPLMKHRDEASAVAGFIVLEGKPIMVCARPIIKSNDEGPIVGTLIMGRYLDAPHIARLGTLTGISVTALPVSSSQAFAGDDGTMVLRRGRDTLEGYTLLRDLNGQPCSVLRIRIPRRIYQMAEVSVAYFVLILLAANLIIGLAGFLVLERHVIRRLAGLNRDVTAMSAEGAVTRRLWDGTTDEVGSLAAEFDELLAKLERYAVTQKAINEELDRRVVERTHALNESRSEIQRLYRHMEEVREVERRRASERVHDELGQSLTALKMSVEGVRIKVHAADPALSARFAEMVTLIDEMTSTMQDIAMELRPSMLDHFGLQAAIQWAVRKFAQRSGIECQLDADEFTIAESTTAMTMFRILQELLTNVARHAVATVVFVRVKREPGRLRLEVEDNGRGITNEEINSPNAFGLTAVRERVAGLGGEVTIEVEDGTRVSVSVPWTDVSTG